MSHMAAYTNQSIMARYQGWDNDNPDFYPKFVQFAMLLAQRGHKRISAKLVFERLRWEHMLNTTGEFKLNNNYTAIYARRFMDDHPQYGDLFKLRSVH